MHNAIEIMANIAQNEILLSEREAHRAIWGQTVNWKGGEGKNVQADLMQENRNCDHKAMIKGMGANKTANLQAIQRATNAACAQRKLKTTLMTKLTLVPILIHTHRSLERDEAIILQDLRRLRPFKIVSGRMHPSFP